MVARGVRSFSWKSAFITIGFTFLGLCLLLALFLQNERSRAALFSNPVNLIVLIGIVPLMPSTRELQTQRRRRLMAAGGAFLLLIVSGAIAAWRMRAF